MTSIFCHHHHQELTGPHTLQVKLVSSCTITIIIIINNNNKQSTEMESYIAAWRRNSSMYMSVHVSIQVCRYMKLKKICLIEMAKKLYTFACEV